MKTQPGLFSRYFFLFSLFSCMATMGFSLISATLSIYVTGIGFSASYAGVLISILSIGAGVFRLLGGQVIDRRGRKATIILGFLLYALGAVGMGFAHPGWFMSVMAFVCGSGFALSGMGISVALVDVLPEQRLGEGISYFGLSSSLGQSIGPTLGLAVLAAFGYPVLMGGTGGLLLVMTLLGFACRYESDPIYQMQGKAEGSAEELIPPETYRHIWKYVERRAIPSALVTFFVWFPHACTMAFLALYAQRQGIPNAGLFFTLSAIAGVIVRIVAGKATDRFGTLPIVVAGIALNIIGFGLLLLSPSNRSLYYISGIFNGLALGVATPALNLAALRDVPAERRGTATGTYSFAIEIAFASSVAAGVVIDKSGFPAMFGTCILCMLLGLGCAIFFFRARPVAQP